MKKIRRLIGGLFCLAGLVFVLLSGCELEADSPFLKAIEERIEEDVEESQDTGTTFSVVYNGNGYTSGAVPVDNTVYKEGDTAIVLGNINGMEKTGHSFLNWNTAENGSANTYESGDEIPIATHNITLYAQWSAIPYTVTLNRQSGTGGSTQVTAFYGSPMPNADAPTRAGFTFGGYYSETEGNGIQYYSPTMSSQRNWDSTENKELFAKWTPITYTITFSSDDIGASGAMAQQNIPCGSTVQLSPCSFSKTGWTFAGWATSSGGSYIYANQANYTMGASNVTLYADWTPPAVFQIRDRGWAGGWIIYDKGSYSDGWRYMEAAAEDQAAMMQGTACRWGTEGFTVTGADGTAIGTGQQNTTDIITYDSAADKAADICDTYSIMNRGSTYSNWFLPSEAELLLIYTNLKAVGVGGFNNSDTYWSSTELSADKARAVYFFAGESVEIFKNDEFGNVRAVRRF